jgi:hypothetical protein
MRTPIKRVLLPLSAALALGIAANAGAQAIGVNIRTGDVWVDSRMVEINDYGYRYREPFVTEVVTNYDVPRPYVEELLVQRKWAPADVYYACALAHSMGRPCADVVSERERDRGQGWGVTAKRLGIKPGSKEFFALKNGVAGSYGRWGHPIAIDRTEHVSWGDNGGRIPPGHMKPAKIKHAKFDKGPDGEHGHGNGGKHGHGHGKDKGDEGDGNDGGQGKDHGNGHGNGKGKGHGK